MTWSNYIHLHREQNEMILRFSTGISRWSYGVILFEIGKLNDLGCTFIYYIISQVITLVVNLADLSGMRGETKLRYLDETTNAICFRFNLVLTLVCQLSLLKHINMVCFISNYIKYQWYEKLKFTEKFGWGLIWPRVICIIQIYSLHCIWMIQLDI